jgi:replication factor A1
MNTQDIIQAILSKHPEVTEEQILQSLAEEQNRSGGLIGDETLMRLIAAKFGVKVPQNNIYSGALSSNRLFAGLNDVTVEGRLIAVFPVRSFQGEKSGKFATLMMVDNDGVLRVVLWNDKAELVEKGDLKAGMVVRFVHGYTREDRYGKIELHLGGRSKIETYEKSTVYPGLEKFATKTSELSKTYRNVHLAGTVREVYGSSTFTKGDMGEGKVLRFKLADDFGIVTVIAWNEKADELEKTLKPNMHLELVNVKVKESQSGILEVHLDSGSFVNSELSPLELIKIGSLKEDTNANVEGEVCSADALKEVKTGKGETVKLLVFELKDDSGVIRVSVWRQQAEELNGLKVGDKVTIENGYVKKGYGSKPELTTRSSTVIKVKKT